MPSDKISILIERLKKKEERARKAVDYVCSLERKILAETIRQQPHISDHALVRILERVYGIDIAALKRKVLSDQDRIFIGLGATKIKKGRHYFVIKGKAVVTVI